MSNSHPTSTRLPGDLHPIHCHVELLTTPAALTILRCDLNQATRAHILAYQMQADFLADLFAFPLANGAVSLLVNHTQTPAARQLLAQHPNLTARTWAFNRMMHAKLIVLAPNNVVWIGSHNLTRYAWTIGRNISARLRGPDATCAATDLYHRLFDRAQALEPWDGPLPAAKPGRPTP